MPDDKDTTLILAGDLWTGTHFIEYAGRSWITKVSTRFKNVLIVLGNHDYWQTHKGLTISRGGDTCNAMLQDFGLFNVKVLDCDTWQEDDVLIIGATLWTDMNKRDPLAMYNMPNFMRADGKISYETGPNGQWSRFTSEKWVHEHSRHRGYINHILTQNRDKKCVVVTHHQPLEQMGDPAWKGHHANAYYYSDLGDMILMNENISMWICGHSHIRYDEQFEHCRLYMNAVGYATERNEAKGNVIHKYLEI